MSKEYNKTKIAWDLWSLLHEFADLIWDLHEEELLENYLQKEEDDYFDTWAKEYSPNHNQHKTKDSL